MLANEFSDIAGGKNARRPGFQAALKRCRQLGATLVAARSDRITRRAHTLTQLLENGYSVRVAEMPGADDLMMRIYAALAQKERELISERTRAAPAAAEARDAVLGGRPGIAAANGAVRLLRPLGWARHNPNAPAKFRADIRFAGTGDPGKYLGNADAVAGEGSSRGGRTRGAGARDSERRRAAGLLTITAERGSRRSRRFQEEGLPVPTRAPGWPAAFRHRDTHCPRQIIG